MPARAVSTTQASFALSFASSGENTDQQMSFRQPLTAKNEVADRIGQLLATSTCAAAPDLDRYGSGHGRNVTSEKQRAVTCPRPAAPSDRRQAEPQRRR